MFPKIIITVILFACLETNAEELLCKGNPDIVSPCYETRGRVQVTNGTPGLRMWKVGTNRMLGIVPSESEIMPDNLSKHIGTYKHVFGDYIVCPFTKERSGWMQMICVESAKNLRVEDYSKDFRTAIVTKIPNE